MCKFKKDINIGEWTTEDNHDWVILVEPAAEHDWGTEETITKYCENCKIKYAKA